jgi:hypothetical protein
MPRTKKTVETNEATSPSVEELKAQSQEAPVETKTEDNSRTPRTLEEREFTEEEMPWKPSRMLPTPNPQEGIDFRYVRVSSGGTIDNMNHSQALRDHWVPVMASEVPECGMILSDVGSAEGAVVLGGMMLCKRDKRIGDRMRAMRNKQSVATVESVDKGYLSDQNQAMQKFSEGTSTTNSRKPNFGG